MIAYAGSAGATKDACREIKAFKSQAKNKVYANLRKKKHQEFMANLSATLENSVRQEYELRQDAAALDQVLTHDAPASLPLPSFQETFYPGWTLAGNADIGCATTGYATTLNAT